MDTLDKQRELVKLIDESEGDLRKAYKDHLTDLIQNDLSTKEDKITIDRLQAELAIKSNM